MTMNKIFRKLRGKNRSQYRLLAFCIFLSVLLVSSFSFMYFGPTVQEFLPDGGDTRKLANLLLGVTVAGCCIFTVYASTLFFRYKSREYGIFLALGEPKRELKKVLFGELSLLCAAASLAGILCGIPASFLIWKLFEAFLITNAHTAYRFGIGGLIAGLLFALLLALFLGITGQRFINRTDIMDILRAGQKTEMVKTVKPYTLPLGIILTAAGVCLGFGLHPALVYLFRQSVPGTSLFYLLALIGIYLILLSAVSQSRLGKNRKKFYKNMVSVSMMRFSAKSATRNMCVIVLMLFACIFSSFYGMLYVTGTKTMGSSGDLRAFALHYPVLEDQVKKADIEKTAKKHSAAIKDFCEGDVSDLVISYKMVDYDDGKYIDVDAKEAKLALFLSAKAYKALTGDEVKVAKGSYKTVTPADYQASIWDYTDGLYAAANPDTGKSLSLSFAGTLEAGSIYAMSRPYAYVINDKDYASLTKDLSAEYEEHIILFDTADNDSSYDFARDLYGQYVSRAGELSCHIGNYDAWEEHLSTKQGETYDYSGKPDLSQELIDDWKYGPQFSIISKVDALQLLCIYVMLCLYIFIICLSAAAVMSYVRSISIAEGSREIFYNLERLGADAAYRDDILRKQLSRIFRYPAVLGCLLGVAFAAFMCFANDRRFTADEAATLGIILGIMVLVLMFLTGVYYFSRAAARRIVRL